MADPIMAALLGGLAAAAGKVASDAVQDAYAGLKALLIRKLGAQSEAADALARLEAKPDSEGRQATLAEELATARAADQADLLDAARRLQAALDALPPEGRAAVQTATGNYIAQASGNSTAQVIIGRDPSAPRS